MNTALDYPKITPYGAKYIQPEGPNEIVRSLGLKGFRLFGSATASLRCLPDYLIIGTKRGGTTSLARWLNQHDQIAPLFPARETRKGMYFFDVNYDKGLGWYKSHFPTKFAHDRKQKSAGKKLLLGDATPYYLHHPHAPKRARRIVPDAKVIALLRNPIERAFSHWVERSRQNVETLSFEEAIEAEAERLAGEEQKMLDNPGYTSYAHQHFSYIDQGRYARGLGRWFDSYGRDRLLVIKAEDLYDNPRDTYGHVLNYLGIGEHEPKEFAAWNKKSKPEFSLETRSLIADALADDIKDVEDLLGYKMGWE